MALAICRFRACPWERISGCSCFVAKAANFFSSAEWPQGEANGVAASCVIEEEEEEACIPADQKGSTRSAHTGSPTAPALEVIASSTTCSDGTKLSALQRPSDGGDAAQLASLLRAAISYCREGGPSPFSKMRKTNRDKGVKLYADILHLLGDQTTAELPRNRWPDLSVIAAGLCSSPATAVPNSPQAALQAVLSACSRCSCPTLPYVHTCGDIGPIAHMCRSCNAKRNRGTSKTTKSARCSPADKDTIDPLDEIPISQVCELAAGPTAETATPQAAGSPITAGMDLVMVSSVSSDPPDAAERHVDTDSLRGPDIHAGMTPTSFADQPQSSSIQQMLVIGYLSLRQQQHAHQLQSDSTDTQPLQLQLWQRAAEHHARAELAEAESALPGNATSSSQHRPKRQKVDLLQLLDLADDAACRSFVSRLTTAMRQPHHGRKWTSSPHVWRVLKNCNCCETPTGLGITGRFDLNHGASLDDSTTRAAHSKKHGPIKVHLICDLCLSKQTSG